MTSQTSFSIAPPTESVWRRLGRFAVSTAVVAGSAAYVVTHNPALFLPGKVETAEMAQGEPAPQSVVATATPPATPAAAAPVAATPVAAPPAYEPAPSTADAEQPHRPYKDGEFKGKKAYAYFGDVIVAAVISNNRLIEVKVLEYPNDRKTSDDISSPALVVLRKQALARQTGKVDVVSGATLTSMAYAESLKSALNVSARR